MARSKYLKAPFPWAGGKSRWSDEVWSRFGPCDAYLEPFAGSLAMLLRNPWPCDREIVVDKFAHLPNFWRAIQRDPLEVAKWADYPSSHMDLHARHVWLVKWNAENHDRLWSDADFYDAKAAGWYAWGVSNWIGSDFATMEIVPDKVQNIGRGLNAEAPEVFDKRPLIHGGRKATGIGVQQQNQLQDVPDKVPVVVNGASGDSGGSGVQYMAKQNVPFTDEGMPFDGTRLQPWLLALHNRIKRAYVIHRDWQLGVTKTMRLAHSDKAKNVAIFLDPPYRTDQGNRSDNIYASDRKGESTDAAVQSYEWAVEHGREERLRIAYCCRDGDFPVPDGWSSTIRDFSGVRDRERRKKHKEAVFFSPGCGEYDTSSPAHMADMSGHGNQEELF